MAAPAPETRVVARTGGDSSGGEGEVRGERTVGGEARAARRQIAALPVRRMPDGSARVLLVTSRETGRWIVPKGWPVKGMTRHEAAALEATEEAGVTGRISREPVGTYLYWKRHADRFELCEVAVYVLEVERQLDDWREKGQRRLAWMAPEEAADLVQEPALGEMIRALA
jgi:8-oxo-dGTP pyrophosphatase MutT (NUDIX family)